MINDNNTLITSLNMLDIIKTFAKKKPTVRSVVNPNEGMEPKVYTYQKNILSPTEK
jgi:hypothetical protein